MQSIIASINQSIKINRLAHSSAHAILSRVSDRVIHFDPVIGAFPSPFLSRPIVNLPGWIRGMLRNGIA